MKLIAIDPGKHACGVALFDAETKELEAAAFVEPYGEAPTALAVVNWIDAKLGLRHGFAVAVEFPRVYPAAQQKGDQNDLLAVAAVAGGVEVGVRARSLHCYSVVRVEPRKWKGTIDGDVMVERIKSRLSEFEHGLVELPSAKSKAHNVWDAVGIGLHALGRLEPRRVFPR